VIAGGAGPVPRAAASVATVQAPHPGAQPASLPAPGQFVSVPAERVLDTRHGTGETGRHGAAGRWGVAAVTILITARWIPRHNHRYRDKPCALSQLTRAASQPRPSLSTQIFQFCALRGRRTHAPARRSDRWECACSSWSSPSLSVQLSTDLAPMLPADSARRDWAGSRRRARCPSTCERTSWPPVARSCRIGRALYAATGCFGPVLRR
jgi:hypothetical protein